MSNQYSQIGNQVVRDDGYVGLQHHSSNGAPVTVGGRTYIFAPQYNISFAWIHPEHVGKLLSIKTSVCCGQNNHQKFILASLINTYLWHGLDRNGNPK